MSYLKKNERQEAILQTAIQIMLQDGISAVTARAIAKTANIAVGQIHHHFESVNQLKAQALLQVSNALIDSAEEIIPDAQNLAHQVMNMVAPIPNQAGANIRRLWNEAVYLAEHDEHMKAAYETSLTQWQHMLYELLLSSTALDETQAHHLSWQLMGLSYGLDQFHIIHQQTWGDDFIREQIFDLLEKSGILND